MRIGHNWNKKRLCEISLTWCAITVYIVTYSTGAIHNFGVSQESWCVVNNCGLLCPVQDWSENTAYRQKLSFVSSVLCTSQYPRQCFSTYLLIVRFVLKIKECWYCVLKIKECWYCVLKIKECWYFDWVFTHHWSFLFHFSYFFSLLKASCLTKCYKLWMLTAVKNEDLH